MRILAVILSCKKNEHLWEGLRAKMDKDMLIFSGGADVSYFDEATKMLHLKCNDLYDGLPEKIICMIHHVLNLECFADVTHIIKIDDVDTIWDKSHIDNLYSIDELNTHDYIGQHAYGGKYGNISRTYHYSKVHNTSYWRRKPYKGTIVEYCGGGHTYILSRNAMTLINNTYNIGNMASLYKLEIYEDLMIGKTLNKYGIVPKIINYNVAKIV
jgi:hypothetical protein